MPYKAIFFLAILFTTAAKLIAQKDGVAYVNQIKVSPLRIIDPVYSGYEISYERRHSTRYSTQFSYGYLTKTFFHYGYEDYKGFRLGLEEKYFIKTWRKYNKYFSIEAVYQANHLDGPFYFYHDSTTTSRSFYYTDSVKVNRKTTIVNVRYGKQLNVSRFVIDLSIGLGIRFRQVGHEGKIYPADDLAPPRHPNVHYEANRQKNDAALNIPLNLRLGVMF